MSATEHPHFIGWRASRLAGINKYIDSSFFSGKSLLDIGCGDGGMGNNFVAFGANVTCADARQKFLDEVKTLYPSLPTLQIDAEKDTIAGHYDVVHSGGLLYHLGEIENHIKNLSEVCNVLIMESEVTDSDDPTHVTYNSESYGDDQAFNGTGIRPSAPYVENLLTVNGFEFARLDDPIFNYDFHEYDWVVSNTGIWRNGLRRFWVCWKGVASPLIAGVTCPTPTRPAVAPVETPSS